MKTYKPGDHAWYFGDGTGPNLRIVVIVGVQNEDQPNRLLVLDGHEIGLDYAVSELQPLHAGRIWMNGTVFRYAEKGKFDAPELPIEPGTVVRHKTDGLRTLGVVDSSNSDNTPVSHVCVHWGHKDSFLRSVDIRDLR